MSSRNIGLGIFLLSIGVIWVLANVGVITWSVIDALLILWPVALIVVGINIMFKNNAIVRAVTWVLFLAIIISYSFVVEDKKSDRNQGMQESGQYVSFEIKPGTESGKLDLSLGGLEINLDSNTLNLMDAVINDSDIRHSIDYKNGEKTAVIVFDKKNYFNFKGRSDSDRRCDFHLNNNVLWDMEIDVGEVSGTLDMADLKVRDFDLDAGAGNLKLVMGNRYERTAVKIDAGASKLEIVVPESSGVRVQMDGGLNKSNFEELNWVKNGNYYQSRNYDYAANKIDMDIDMGVGKLTIITE